MTARARAALLSLALAGCEPLAQIQQLKTFSRCEFRLASVADTALAGVAIHGRHGPNELSALDAFAVGRALKAKTLPLTFTLNVEARNPNGEPAAMNKLAWILLVDGRELTSGLLDRRVEVAPNGGVAPVPLAIAVDLKQVLAGESLQNLANLAFNVAGLGERPTRITLKAKPSILVAGQLLDYPGYLDVSVEFGGTPPAGADGGVAGRLDALLRP